MQSLTEKHIRTLWLRMGQLYGHHWTSAHGEHDADNTWLKILQGVTPQMIGKALRQCAEHYKTWPPTLMEFRELCLGLPKKEIAKTLAISGEPTDDPFILEMRKAIGSWNLSHCTYAELDRLANLAFVKASEKQTMMQLALTSPQQEYIGHE